MKMPKGMGMIVGWGHASGLLAMHLVTTNHHGDLHLALTQVM